MRRLKQLVVATIASMLIALTATLAVPTAAHALPNNCNKWVATDGRGYAHCTGGSGYYKVGISCRPIGIFGFYGYAFTAKGEWARVGGSLKSVAKCPLGSSNWSANGVYYAWIDQTAETI